MCTTFPNVVRVFALSFSNNFAHLNRMPQRQEFVRACVCVYMSVCVFVCMRMRVFMRMTVKTNNDINLIIPLCH